MENEIGVFNPLSTDFSVNYDLGDGNGPQAYTVPSREIAYFSPAVAKHIKKHLFNAIVNARGLNGIAIQANGEKEKIEKEISVE